HIPVEVRDVAGTGQVIQFGTGEHQDDRVIKMPITGEVQEAQRAMTCTGLPSWAEIDIGIVIDVSEERSRLRGAEPTVCRSIAPSKKIPVTGDGIPRVDLIA